MAALGKVLDSIYADPDILAMMQSGAAASGRAAFSRKSGLLTARTAQASLAPGSSRGPRHVQRHSWQSAYLPDRRGQVRGAATQRMCDRHMWDVRPYPSVHRRVNTGAWSSPGSLTGTSRRRVGECVVPSGGWVRLSHRRQSTGCRHIVVLRHHGRVRVPDAVHACYAPTFEVVGSFVYAPRARPGFVSCGDSLSNDAVPTSRPTPSQARSKCARTA